MKKTLKMLCGIICLLSVVLITLSGCDMGNLFDGSVNVPKGDGFTPVYYGMLMSTSPDVEIPPVSYEDVVKENAGNNGNHNGWYKKPDKDKENNGNTDNNGNHYGWYKDDNGDGKLDEDFQQQLCYLSQNQDVYFYVGIGNPAQLEIVSIQINGKTYTSDMFEANSTNEVKILKHNVGNAGGIVEYTIEEIKYSDGTEVKDVVLAGNKTARAGIKVENAVTATVNNIELRDSGKEIFFDITIADDYSLIANSNGVITVTVYRDGKSVKSTELIVGKNEVTIETLNKNKEHEYEIVAYYDDLLGEGATYHTLISRRPVQEIHTHTFDVWTVTKEASCTEDGEKMRTCTACGEIETEKISATGKHAFGEWKVTKCGALGESGEKTRTCSVCGETETQVFIDVVEIEWVTTKAVSCTEDGERTRTCPICGETETEIIPAPGKHSVGAWVITKDVSCTENGEETRTCAACGEEETRAILATGHKWSHACDTTCNVVGCDYTRVTEHTYDNACDADCNICGEIRVVLGHVYDNACDADCNECGFTRVTDHTYDDQYDAVCNVCGFVRDAECAHKNVITLPGKEANCIETGLTEGQKCGDCGETIVEQTIIPATGIHNYESTVTPPTATENGVITYTCSCTNSYTEELVPSDFTITADNRTMVGYTGEANENLVIPAVFEDNGTWYRVVGIDEWALYGSIGLANVTIPETMRTIGAFSFVECDGLISVTMLGATTIGYNAFNSCDQLSTVTFPNSLTTIEGFAFFACVSLENITIPNSVTVIGECAFRACYKLTSMHIPASVTTIGYGVFGECTGLIAITVDADNPVYYSEGNCIIERDSKALIQGCKTSVIPQDTTRISREAFYWISLTNVTIPNTVTTIGEAAFSWTGLDSITFTGTIAQWMNIEKGSRWDDGTENYTVYCTDGTIAKDGTITYYEVASKGLEFTLNPDGASYSVTGIGTCTDTDIIIPSEYEGLPVTAIGDYAFFLCANLTSITIGDSITTIGDFAIGCCANLTSVTIGGSVTTISTYTFYDCANLTSIVVDVGNTAYQSINENLYTKDGTILIAYAIGKTDTSFAIPNSVTTIGDYAFYDCTNLTSVTIPGSVTTIGDYAFHFCTNLTSVTIPVSVITIGDYAFAACTNLTSATIGDSVTFIGGHAFSNCYNLTNITIPNSVTTIKIGTFASCTNLTSVTISTSVTAIDESAFAWSSNLTDVYYTGSGSEWEQITIGYDNDYLINATRYYYSETQPTTEGNFWHYVDGVPTVWEVEIHTHSYTSKGTPSADYATVSVTYTCSGCGHTYSETITPTDFTVTAENRTMVGFTGAANENLVIPAVFEDNGIWYRVTAIGYIAFHSCNNLTSVTIGDSVTSIGWDAFAYCDNLTSVTIPDSVTTIGGGAFSSCSSLTSITIPDSVTTIGYEAFRFCSELTSITIPDSVTTIGSSAFSSCTNLTSVTIGDSVTTIGDSAFYYCSRLTNLTIPDSVTTIGDGAFSSCSSLTSITIPDAVTTIGDSAFRDCTNLTSVTIPDSVTTIGDYAFLGCFNLTSITLGYSVTTIGEWAFQGCSNLTSVTIPDSVTAISSLAFSGCSSLTSITIPDSVTSISYQAFSGCFNLTSVIIGDSVTTIGDDAFSTCYNITSVTIGNSVTTIGNSAFSSCSSLTSVTIPDSVTTIGDRAFEWCSNLTSVMIPNSVTTIGNSAFSSCSGLTSIVVDEGNTAYQSINGNFYSKDGTLLITYASGKTDTTFVVPSTVTTIGSHAFSTCYNLTSVAIPDSVTTIDDYAFFNCIRFTSVTIPDSVTTIGHNAFSRCHNLTSITFSGTIEQWNAIEKGDYWNGSSTPATEVICSDGVVSLV